jgi:hypothetical protein
MKYIETLLKYKVEVVFALAGVLFIFLSMFAVQDITKLQATFATPIKTLPFVIGIVFIFLSLILCLTQWFSFLLSWTAVSKVSTTACGFQISLAHAKVEVCFGQIQDFNLPSTHVVALPANDQFDDECINDSRSALGSFVNNKFTNKIHEICKLAQMQLNSMDVSIQGKSVPQKYKIGKTIYFERPLCTDIKMAFVAVTTVSENEGIRCEAENVFMAIKGLHKLMNEHRIDGVILPLFGSGHGGLRPEMSLLCSLMAFAECLSQPSGCHIKDVRIVIFQKTKDSPPQISPWQVRKLLALVKKYC